MVVGRRGLEPRTSALIRPERFANESGTLHETAGVIRRGCPRATGRKDEGKDRTNDGTPAESPGGFCLKGGYGNPFVKKHVMCMSLGDSA